MALTVNTNIASLKAANSLNTTQGNLSTCTQSAVLNKQ